MASKSVITIEAQPDIVIARVEATDLFEENAKALQAELTAASQSNPLPFVVDIARVKIVPSLSLGILVRLASDFRGRGQRIILAAAQPMVRQVLAITRIDRIFEIQDSVEAAIRAVRPA